MRAWQIAVAGAALLAPAGCRTDPAIPILERDNFRLERENEHLRAMIEDLQCEVRGNGQPAATKTPADSATFAPRYKSGAEGRSEAPENEPPGEAPSVVMPPHPSPKVPEMFNRPTGARPIDPSGRQPDAPGAGPDGPALDQGDQSSLQPVDAAGVRQASLAVPIHPSGTSQQVASIAIDCGLSGGIAAAGGPGDDGLLLVVAPRDRLGRPVAAPADMSVAVYDPALRDEEGMAVLVGRWDFTAAETASLFRRTGPRHAVHLSMAWPNGPPKHPKLHVFVRYVTADGRKLQADGSIDVGRPERPPTRRAATPVSAAPPAERNDGPQLLPVDATTPPRPVWSPERQ